MKHALIALALALVAGNCAAADIPDLGLTPGLARTDITQHAICSTKWGIDQRHVTQMMKRQVFDLYGMTGNADAQCTPDRTGRRCEIDHIISRELGGADDVRNLWPQAYGSQPWNAALKDRLENRLHKEVCAGNLGLSDAQFMLINDWRVAYRRYFGEPK